MEKNVRSTKKIIEKWVESEIDYRYRIVIEKQSMTMNRQRLVLIIGTHSSLIQTGKAFFIFLIITSWFLSICTSSSLHISCNLKTFSLLKFAAIPFNKSLPLLIRNDLIINFTHTTNHIYKRLFGKFNLLSKFYIFKVI